MHAHGYKNRRTTAAPRAAAIEQSLGATASGLAGRHMFGPPSAAERWAGGRADEAAEDLLRRLGRLMVQIGRGPDGASVNRNIPAGYTYLAQLVAHDVVHNTTALAAADIRTPDINGDRRVEPLVLETIYAGGPYASPQIYARPARPEEPRYRLRLGQTRTVSPTASIEPPRDIARIACPHLNDWRYEDGQADSLVGDPRNDDNLILSQLTVVFHLLHNLTVDRLVAASDPLIRGLLEGDPHQGFLLAQRLVARVYRDIVVGDLLDRLLDRNVSSYYRPRDGRPHFFDDSNDGSVPLEFSFGAFRFGHSLVRRSYPLNAERGRTGVTDILLQTSQNRGFAMPLDRDWLIEWSRFFDLRSNGSAPVGSAQRSAPEFSRRIGPSTVDALARAGTPLGSGVEGGLAFEDLRSGAAAGLRSPASLLAKFRECGALDKFFQEHPLYGDAAASAAAIRNWLEERVGLVDKPEQQLTPAQREAIATDPPLLFFVLLEAELVAHGERLGPLGSLILAESLMPLLERKRAVIEGEADGDRNLLKAAAARAFGGEAPPRTMPELLTWLAGELRLNLPESHFL